MHKHVLKSMHLQELLLVKNKIVPSPKFSIKCCTQVLISGELDYWDEDVQNEIENLTRTFEQSPYVSPSSFFTESWLRSFVGYVDRNRDAMNISVDTKESFMKTLKEVTARFKYTLRFKNTYNGII